MVPLFVLANLFLCSLCAQMWRFERGEDWLYVDDRKSWRTGSSDMFYATHGVINLNAPRQERRAAHADNKINGETSSLLEEYDYIDSGKKLSNIWL
uniref:Putative conserved secreted protein n=1 Tax=Amblyomma tuberculatum TaxID=48802 RepID=A0A6M2E463_9ACAR